MNDHKNDLQIISKLMFRLLLIQILLAMTGAVNGFVSSFFAANYVGIEAMSAVGLYSPISMFLGAIAALISGGCAVICGKYLGQNEKGKLQNVFSLDLIISSAVSLVFTAGIVILSRSEHLMNFFTANEELHKNFSRYLLGQTLGVYPLILSSQLPTFLSMENKSRRSLLASVIYIIVNLILNFLFVQVMNMQELGLSFASSLGMWALFAVELQYFLSGKSERRLTFKDLSFSDAGSIVRVGFPGAASNIYQTIRGLIVNHVLEVYTGSIGLSAFATANNVMNIFWSIPAGMMAVSRLLISVSTGEEDRQTLVNIMKVMMRRFIPLMIAVDACIIASAPVLASLFFRESEALLRTAECLRILPLCMPFSILLMHFTCLGQSMNRSVFLNIASLLDGVLCVAGFSILLVPLIGVSGACIANVANGVVTTIFIIAYAWFKNRKMPRNMEDLMALPQDFGVAENERIDISVTRMEEVIRVSQKVQDFCLSKGIDRKRAYLAGLAMEEMAGNIVDHGFTKDNKKHSIDIRVVHKDGDIILRIKDDCVPFDPKDRNRITDGDDPAKNIGIRMIYGIMNDINYENLLGLNVLTIRI